MSFLQELDQLPAEKRWPAFRAWMTESPLALFKEVLTYRPVIDVPELTLVTRYSDCAQVMRQHDVFSVRLYVPKQGPYWMNQDDTARHWREKSIMKSILDFEALASIRGFIADKTSALLDKADGHIDVVKEISRAVPAAMVQEIFGFDEVDPDDLIEWSYWSQQDTFHNQHFDADVIKDQQYVTEMREKTRDKLSEYLAGLVQRRAADLQAGKDLNDPTTRLLRLSLSQGVQLTPELVGLNVGGLLIGTVETTSHTAINALSGLLDPPPGVQATLSQALSNKDDITAFDGHVFEMLRFKPAFPYI
ncbi:MAG: cytochrome P450 [Gammaproteobacteria bacterium]